MQIRGSPEVRIVVVEDIGHDRDVEVRLRRQHKCYVVASIHVWQQPLIEFGFGHLVSVKYNGYFV